MDEEYVLKTSVLYDIAYERIGIKKHITIFQGGTGSGKTYSIMQCLCIYCIENKMTDCLVVGRDIPNLKIGAIKDLMNIIYSSDFVKSKIEGYNKTEMLLRFKNGSEIQFKSFDSEQGAKPGKRKVLFINECDGIDFRIFWTLEIKSYQHTFLDYNPTNPFWVQDKVLNGKDYHERAKLYISDHRHNPFLSKEAHDSIENIEDNDDWLIYARGKTGSIQGSLLPMHRLKFVSRNDILTKGELCYSFSTVDPADGGGDKFSGGFYKCYIYEDRLWVFVSDVIHSKDGIEYNGVRVAEKLTNNRIDEVFIERNGVGDAAIVEITDKMNRLNTPCIIKPFWSSVKKEIRISSNYETVRRFFCFDTDYKTDFEMARFMIDATTYRLEETKEFAHKKDSIDTLCTAAEIIKVKFSEYIYK